MVSTILWSNCPIPILREGIFIKKILREGISTSYKIEWVQRGLSDGPWFMRLTKGLVLGSMKQRNS